MNDKIKSMMNKLEELSRGNHFFLNEDHTYRPCGLMEWGKQLQTMERHVADDQINDCRVSTIWLGTDHNHWGGPPLVFETMIFKEGSDIYCERYTTWQEAEAGHKEAIQWVLDGYQEND